MGKRVWWMGVVAAAVLLVAVLAPYFMPKVEYGRLHHDKTPNVDQTVRTPQLSPTLFNASAYEVNYTVVFTVSYIGITVTIEGWLVVGVGPAGNYSYGMLTAPSAGTATYKSATVGNTVYTMRCLRGRCEVEKGRPFAILKGVNVARTAKGQCPNYTGVLYEERGALEAPFRSIEDFSGNYTAYVCEVNGVVLSADITATATARNKVTHLTVKIEAVKVGPYNEETYRSILKEIKTNK